MSPSPVKKAKTEDESDENSSLADQFAKLRESAGENVCKFKFNIKRAKLLTGSEDFLHREALNGGVKGVAYYMHRDQRLQDNWAALFAQKLALEDNVPLYVIAGISVSYPDHDEATRRTIDFSLGGLEEVAKECAKLNIEFHLLQDMTKPMADRVMDFVKESKVGCVVTDFSPLRAHSERTEDLKEKMAKLDGPCFYQVDAHNVVPVWETSDQQELNAREIRKKIMCKLGAFLTEFPPVIKHPVDTAYPCKAIDWDLVKKEQKVDESVKSVEWAIPGTLRGYEMLASFITNRITIYDKQRNDPNVKALSNLSPWFHTGQLSVQRSVLQVKRSSGTYEAKGIAKHPMDMGEDEEDSEDEEEEEEEEEDDDDDDDDEEVTLRQPKTPAEAAKAFIEEAIVRSELSDNFCYYNEKYDEIEGAADWAVATLNKHREDKRKWLYTRDELAEAKTHDELWNSAQIQLTSEGKMHGFLRMYWGKKILEWTESPEQALEFAHYFNDHYSLDGADSNGIVGCMWCVAGLHDQGWVERSVFGTVRYMSYVGCKGKFDIAPFVAKYGGQVHPYTKIHD